MEIKLSFQLKLHETNIQEDSNNIQEKINKLAENYENLHKEIETLKTDFSLNDKNVINEEFPANFTKENGNLLLRIAINDKKLIINIKDISEPIETIYESGFNIDDFISKNDVFKKYKNIKEAYEELVSLINKNKFEIKHNKIKDCYEFIFDYAIGILEVKINLIIKREERNLFKELDRIKNTINKSKQNTLSSKFSIKLNDLEDKMKELELKKMILHSIITKMKKYLKKKIIK